MPGTGITTTVLGFGCAHLLNVSRKNRQRLLETAFEAGIRHFDVAPMYGLGAAETELGRFASGRRDEVVLATKFGIDPSEKTRRLAAWQGPARRVARAIPPVRKFLRSRASALYAPPRYDWASGRASLERSLTRLETEYVDLFFVHEPPPGALPVDELRAGLELEREAGRIRAWGLAGEQEPTIAAAREFESSVPVIQIRDDALHHSPEPVPAAARITFGALAGALEIIVRHVDADQATRRRWFDAVGADCGDRDSLAVLLLRRAIAANPTGVVLFSTSTPDRIRVAASAMEDGDADLATFARLVDQELRQPAVAGR
jgi:D-threo-aldose 1-dehydrogenase